MYTFWSELMACLLSAGVRAALSDSLKCPCLLVFVCLYFYVDTFVFYVLSLFRR